jgi:hypothetical protein
MSLKDAVKENTATLDVRQQERDFRRIYRSLYKVAKANDDEGDYLGDTDHGKYSLFVRLFYSDGQVPSVLLEERDILKCPCCGDVSDLGDVTRAICLDDDGYGYRIDLDDEEDSELEGGEIALVYEAGMRVGLLSKDSITAEHDLIDSLVQPA